MSRLSVIEHLEDRGLQPRTLGVTDYDLNEPLVAVRRIMLESYWLLSIAFRRTFIAMGTEKPNPDIPGVRPRDISGSWLTSPWTQIEAAMAFQIGLPILMFRESGVIAEGVLEWGVAGLYLPEFDLDKPIHVFFQTQEWRQLIGEWEGYVRSVNQNRGRPPKLF